MSFTPRRFRGLEKRGFAATIQSRWRVAIGYSYESI
jgi:hypothetical protein